MPEEEEASPMETSPPRSPRSLASAESMQMSPPDASAEAAASPAPSAPTAPPLDCCDSCPSSRPDSPYLEPIVPTSPPPEAIPHLLEEIKEELAAADHMIASSSAPTPVSGPTRVPVPEPPPATATTAMPAISPVLAKSMSTDPSSPIPKIEITENASSDRNRTDSPRLVPPMLVLQHWGEEWMPVFSRDQEAQAERPPPPEPYSDAYLSGMPARKRCRVLQQRPPTQLDPLMNVSLQETSERTASANNSSLRRALREHMRTLARERAAHADDYDPLHFASAERFLLPRSTPEQPEGEKESK